MITNKSLSQNQNKPFQFENFSLLNSNLEKLYKEF